MCEACNAAFKSTMMKILSEYVELKEIKFTSTNFKERTKEFDSIMKTDEFTKYAKKRIPEIVNETPVFSVFEKTDNGNYKHTKDI